MHLTYIMRNLSPYLAGALVLAISSSAYAGGYLAVGVGSDADIGGDLGGMYSAKGSDHGRLAIGQRTGPLAIEASIFGTGLAPVTGADGDYSAISLGVDLKYYFNLTGPIEAYGRGGLTKTWLGADGSGTFGSDMSGRGYALGAGLQYTFRWLPLGEAAVWVDYTHHSVSLHDSDLAVVDGNVKLLTVGLSIGL